MNVDAVIAGFRDAAEQAARMVALADAELATATDHAGPAAVECAYWRGRRAALAEVVTALTAWAGGGLDGPAGP